MTRTELNFLLDTLLLATFVSLLACALVNQFVFPPGALAHEWTVWGAGPDAWRRLEFGLLVALTLGVLLHVMLHWSWVCGVLATRLARDKKARVDDGLQTIYGVGFLIAILAAIGVFYFVAKLAAKERMATTARTGEAFSGVRLVERRRDGSVTIDPSYELPGNSRHAVAIASRTSESS